MFLGFLRFSEIFIQSDSIDKQCHTDLFEFSENIFWLLFQFSDTIYMEEDNLGRLLIAELIKLKTIVDPAQVNNV